MIERSMISSRCGPEKLHLVVPLGSAEPSSQPLIMNNTEKTCAVISEEAMRLRERMNIEAALKQAGWKMYGTGAAAELLGIKPTTLLSRIKKMRIVKSD